MSWFVLYSDGYCDNGDVGWKQFNTPGGAVGYIEKRMEQKDKAVSLANYTVIHGEKLELEPVEVVRKVKIVGCNPYD